MGIGNETQGLMLQGKHFYQLSYHPALVFKSVNLQETKVLNQSSQTRSLKTATGMGNSTDANAAFIFSPIEPIAASRSRNSPKEACTALGPRPCQSDSCKAGTGRK